MANIKICKHENCSNAAKVGDYCRLHYLRHWKALRDEERQKAAKRLNKYIEGVMKRHPENYMDVIKKDIRNPMFENMVDDSLVVSPGEPIFPKDVSYDEEVEELIRKLKVESGF